MYKILYLLLFICLPGVAPLQGAAVKAKSSTETTPKDRAQAIQQLESFVNWRMYTISTHLYTPFLYNAEEELKAPIIEQVAIEETEAPAEKTPDELIILKRVGNALSPSGSMQNNGVTYLCTRGKKLLREGSKLQANYLGQTYEIKITSIKKKKFTIKLHNYSLTFNY